MLGCASTCEHFLSIWGVVTLEKNVKKSPLSCSYIATNVIAGNDVACVGLTEHCLSKIIHCSKQVHHSVGNLRLEGLTGECPNVAL